jgi:hypothetical protein
MNRITKLIPFLLPITLFAAGGTSGGGQVTIDQITLNLTYGTFSLGGSSFDYLGTNVPLIIDDQGYDLLTSIDKTTGLDPRIYAGITALLALGTTNATLTAPFATCLGTSCTPVADGTTTFSATAPADNVAFSTGGLGATGDVTDASQIIAAAEALNLITGGSVSSSTPEGSLTFTVTSTGEVPTGNGDFIVDTTLTNYVINLEEMDFTGTAPTAAAVPEPSSVGLAAICVGLLGLARISKYAGVVRRMEGPARANRRFRF